MIEHELISALLEAPEKIDDVCELISGEDFSDNNAKLVFNEMDAQRYFDSFTIGNKLRTNHPHTVKWMNTIIGTGFGSSAVDYAKIVKEESKGRRLLDMAQQLINETGSELTKQEVIERMGERLLSLYDKEDKTFANGREMMVRYMERLVMLKERGEDISGLTTGFRTLDLCMDGLRNGNLITVGARPSNGKSSWLTQVAWHVGVDLGLPVCVFSLECSEQVMNDKFISQQARIDTRKLRTGRMDADEEARVMGVMDLMAQGKIYLNDVSSININRIRVELKRMLTIDRPKLVMIDYVQIIKEMGGNKSDTRAKRLGAISTGLKQVAKEMNIPVVQLAQLNRDGTERPSLRSLKESGELEESSDIVLLLHRPGFYSRGEKPDDVIEIECAKNREGATALMTYAWEGYTTRILDPIV